MISFALYLNIPFFPLYEIRNNFSYSQIYYHSCLLVLDAPNGCYLLVIVIVIYLFSILFFFCIAGEANSHGTMTHGVYCVDLMHEMTAL